LADRTLRWVEVPSGRVGLVELGSADGPAVVVVPGLTDGLAPLSEPSALRSLPRPPPALRDRRVLAVTLRHPVEAGATTRDLAGDVATLIDAVVGAPVVVAGHSMGSMVAQHLAADRPDLVRGLVLSATAARADERLRARLERWEEQLTGGDVRGFLRDALDASLTGTARWRQRLVSRVLPPPDVAHLVDRHVALSWACRHHDARDRLERIAVPALVLAGDRDPLVPPDRGREVADRLGDAELVVLPGLAHGFPEQGRAAYVRALVAFLDGRGGAATVSK
jgi:pimeloyl-ACP methyl ester carboxylesterase